MLRPQVQRIVCDRVAENKGEALVSKINGEKARASIARKNRTATREKTRAARAIFLEQHAEKKSVVAKVKESKPVAKVAEVAKKAGDALAELAEMAKPKRKKKEEPTA